jgi:hypothetical protein
VYLPNGMSSVCALDKVKRMNVQFIGQYEAVLAKWDACMLGSSNDCSNLSTGELLLLLNLLLLLTLTLII